MTNMPCAASRIKQSQHCHPCVLFGLSSVLVNGAIVVSVFCFYERQLIPAISIISDGLSLGFLGQCQSERWFKEKLLAVSTSNLSEAVLFILGAPVPVCSNAIIAHILNMSLEKALVF